MHKRNGTATIYISRLISDSVLISVSCVLAALLNRVVTGQTLRFDYVWMVVSFDLIFSLVMFVFRMYNITTFYYFDRIIYRTFLAALLSSAFLLLTATILRLDMSWQLLLLFCTLSFVLVTLSRIVVRLRKKNHVVRTLFVGEEKALKEYEHFIKQTAMRNDFIGWIPFDDEMMENVHRFREYIIQDCISEVHLSYTANSAFDYEPYLLACEEMGITVRAGVGCLPYAHLEKVHQQCGDLPSPYLS